ncbi:MAG: DNA double-strand break repair nuclease NurA [bacterium]|nr:DNA double-strand break repair nuclease NurA [bacterium]
MSLEFNKVIDQVATMGRYLKHQGESASSRLQRALDLFNQYTDLDAVHARIDMVRRSSVSGYRGAAPAPRPYDEMICGVGDAASMPEHATLIAADGSQIFPDAHAPALYYLINIGVFTYFHGQMRVPAQLTYPELHYSKETMLDRDGRLITNQTVNARRSLAEMQWLARTAWENRAEAKPIIALHDGGLLKFFGGAEIEGANDIEKEYMEALGKLYDSGAILAGYLDVPRSTYIISLLHLLSLPPDQINDAVLRTNGEFEGLNDTMLLSHVLMPGERSAVMTQNSPQNKEYRDRKGGDFEVAFFYINVSNGNRNSIIRVDVPMWVAQDKAAVGALHAAILAQCAIQGRRSYPYILTRADELAYVSSAEKAHLEEIIRINMLENHLEPESSSKLQSKSLARGERSQHRLR